MDLEQSNEYEFLMGAALRFVSFRPRSEKEFFDFLYKTLKRHHITAPLVVENVISRLKELGYIDDRAFIDWWVSQRGSFKPKGKRLIEMELRAKGIKNPEIHIDERDLAHKAIAHKLVVWKDLPLRMKKKKIFDYLYRRGFDTSVVDDVLEKE